MPTYSVKPNVGAACVGSPYHLWMELHERLQLARKVAGLKQKDVAAHFRIARPSVAQWETKDSRPDQAKMPALADLYGVALDWLMDGRGEGPKGGVKKAPVPPPQASKFVRNRDYKFYVAEWRKFMVGENVKAPAKACGLDINEYQAFEAYPINFTIGQVMNLAVELGVRAEQLFFPPPKSAPAGARTAPVAKAKRK